MQSKILGEFRLRIFLSVDLIDSTAFKAQLSHRKPAAKKAGTNFGFPVPAQPVDWPPYIQAFFRKFPALLAQETFRARQIIECPAARKAPVRQATPTLWKSLGDELIFTSAVPDSKTLLADVLGLHNATIEYSRQLKDAGGPLRAKATGWLGNFPYPNCELEIERSRADSSIASPEAQATTPLVGSPAPTVLLLTPLPPEIDYFGPDVDSGFRVTKAARENVTMLSFTLAEALAKALAKHTVPDARIDLVGWDKFKGVIDERPYPLFWFSTIDPGWPEWVAHFCPLSSRFLASRAQSPGKWDTAKVIAIAEQVRSHAHKDYLFPVAYTEKELPKQAKTRMRELQKDYTELKRIDNDDYPATDLD